MRYANPTWYISRFNPSDHLLVPDLIGIVADQIRVGPAAIHWLFTQDKIQCLCRKGSPSDRAISAFQRKNDFYGNNIELVAKFR